MHPLILAIPIIIVGLFAVLSLAALIDPRDPALQPERPALARQPAGQRRPRPRLHSYPLAHAHSFVPDSAHPAQPIAQSKERKLHMHTHTGIRWLSLLVVLGLFAGALAFAVAPAWAADTRPSAVVNTGRLNVRTGPGVGYSVVTRLDEGTSVELLARNSAATWVKIRLAGGIEGWVNVTYLRTSMLIADLPVSGSTTPVPTPVPATGTVTAAQLELRAGPGSAHALLATLSQGQALTFLGRTADSTWVKVRANNQEGWVPAQITVVLPGNENGVTTAPFTISVAVSSLAVAGSAPVAPASPRVSLSGVNVRPATPIYINVAGFPANRDIAAVLTSRTVPAGFVVATGRTDASGNAQLFFRQPDMWPSGAAITEAALSLAVGTTDGAVLIWSGLAYRQ